MIYKNNTGLIHKLILLAFTTIIFLSCKKEKVNQVPFVGNSTNIVKKAKLSINDSISGIVNPELGLFDFKFIVDTIHNQLKAIKIYNQGHIFQEITVNKDVNYEYTNCFVLIDCNFDGYKDIKVLSNWASRGCKYWVWNYIKSKNKFVYNNELSDKAGLKIDTLKKDIVFHVRIEGCWNQYWDTCRYYNGKLKFVCGLDQIIWNDEKGNKWKKNIHTKLINNKVVETIDSAIVK